MDSLKQMDKELNSLVNIEKKEFFPKFFKAYKGGYGEGDQFLGLTVPICRKVAKKYKDLPVSELAQLIKDPFHEKRLIALFILILTFEKGDQKKKKEVFDFYIKHRVYVNNWDLVDASAYKIIGNYLKDKDRKILYKFASSKDLWEKRVAIITTYAFIKDNDFTDCLKISEILLTDSHDLIHKAVGWMLREVGNRDQALEEKFLKKFYKKMPRTMLRYSIEKFPESLRKKYLKGEI